MDDKKMYLIIGLSVLAAIVVIVFLVWFFNKSLPPITGKWYMSDGSELLATINDDIVLLKYVPTSQILKFKRDSNNKNKYNIIRDGQDSLTVPDTLAIEYKSDGYIYIIVNNVPVGLIGRTPTNISDSIQPQAYANPLFR